MERRHAIRQLDPSVIGQIAAGEVVERPSFAIKELVENSIDAGATAITIEVRDGGLSFFRVTDNGCGIVPGEIRMAFARHATSKLRTAEELTAIHTLGFRGEALASIAAVSKVTLISRATGHETGTRAEVEGGLIREIQEAASPEGTAITVRDLFFNTPARKKFLKKASTELAQVSDLVLRLILARPDISFRLMNAEKTVYHSPGNGKLKDAMFSVLGREMLTSLVEVKGSAAGCAVYGYVGVGEAARSSRAMQTFILNGRYVRNRFLSQALEEGCREQVMIGKHPVCAMHLTMPFESVDVNVHPNKLEVRFQNEQALIEGMSQLVRSAFVLEPMAAAPKVLLEEKPAQVPVAETAQTQKQPTNTLRLSPYAIPIPTNRPSVRMRDSGTSPMIPADRPSESHGKIATPPAVQQSFVPQEPAAPPVQTEMDAQSFPMGKPIKMIGIAWYEYAFAEQGDRLYIIDQHAAHERILYEKFRTAFDQHVASQQLLVPQVVQLTHREHAALIASQEDLQRTGFDIEDYGDRSIQVRAVPMILGVPQLKDFFGELADRIGEYRAMPTDELRRDILVKFACRKAVKAGDPLSLESVEALIAQMRETGVPPTCPHGRPLLIAIDKSELDKRFRRLV